MPSSDCGLSIRSLAELSLVVSQTASSIIFENAIPASPVMQKFWQSTRALQHRWTSQLANSGPEDLDLLERLAPRIFTCEMAVRTWSTVLSILDYQSGTDDLTRLARNSVHGLLQIRNSVLSRLLRISELHSNRLIVIDRMRRRCDRWTDLLIAPIAARGDCFEFAFDEQRARDFGEDDGAELGTTGPRAVEHLVSAGLRLTFVRYLSPDLIDEPEVIELSQSLLASIPKSAFRCDGSLRSLLEQRIAVSRKRLEGRPDPAAEIHFPPGTVSIQLPPRGNRWHNPPGA